MTHRIRSFAFVLAALSLAACASPTAPEPEATLAVVETPTVTLPPTVVCIIEGQSRFPADPIRRTRYIALCIQGAVSK